MINDQVESTLEPGVDDVILNCGDFPGLTTVEMPIVEVMPRFQADGT